MRGVTIGLAVLVIAVSAGCGSRRSTLLLERTSRGQVGDSTMVAHGITGQLEPVTQTKSDQDIEVSVTHASAQYQAKLFSDKKIFGRYAGKSPYYPEHLVFYLKMANHRSERVLVRTENFVLVDDHGNQFSAIGIDSVTALRESKQPVSTVTRGVLQEARPGYFGFSLPIGKMVVPVPQGPFALMKQSSFESGYLYPGVVHDGLIAFWTPNRSAKQLKLYLAGVKTAFAADETPTASLDFLFEFSLTAEQPAH